MKKIEKLLFALILFVLLSTNVNAANTYFNVTKATNGNGEKCPASTLYLKHVGSDCSPGQCMSFYNFYANENLSSSSEFGQTFCLAPGKNSYRNKAHTCERVINPAKTGGNQAYDVALTRAYQKMVKDGIIKSKPTKQSRIVGTLAFRWLSYYFGKLDKGGTTPNTYPYIYTKSSDNRSNSTYWKLSNKYLETAKKISTDAAKYGKQIKDKKTNYKTLVNKGIIWTDEWNFVLINREIAGTSVTLTFDVTPKAGKAPKTVLWDKFNIECEYGYVCNVISREKISNNKGRYKVSINTENGESSKTSHYGLKVTTAYIDQRNPAAYLMLMYPSPKGKEKYYQKMLLVKNHLNSYIIQTEVPVDYKSNECLCEEKNGSFTGDYIYYQNVNGVTTSEVIKKNDPRVQTLNCPEECPNTKKTCSIDYDNAGKPTYYCKDGSVCDQDKYHKDCLHICETPEQNSEHKYYCKEKETDKGGEECNEDQYLDECYCPPLKEKCEENPKDPECSDYDEKCPNCNANVSVPGTCNDFDVDSSVSGSISDINQEKTECNHSVNPVKRCVIDSVDQTNASYEATTEINNNKYCKVWCDEDYQFNIPTARYSLSGGYFTLSTQITGKRNCYVSSASNPKKPIDVDGFKYELNSLNSDLIIQWNEWNKWNTLYESSAVKNIPSSEANAQKEFSWTYVSYDYLHNTTFTKTDTVKKSKNEIEEIKNEMLENYQKTDKEKTDSIEQFKGCTTWTNNMKFDPVINFTYKDYSSQLNNGDGTGKFSRVGEVTTTIDNMYCLGDTDNQYNCIKNNEKYVSNNDVIPDGIFEDAVSITCNNSGCSSSTFKISKAKWIQKTVTKNANFTPSQNFSTYHQYGTVKTGTVCENANVEGYNNCLWTRLPDDALPVELKTGKGAFPFTLKFSNIGQSNQTGDLGRLVGSEEQKSVLTEYDNLPKENKCTKYNESNGILTQDTGYVCAYVNNCPECDVSCDGNNCLIKTENKTCKNCIFDGANSTYKYRTVSLNELFPNSCKNNSAECREEGYNWSTVKSTITQEEIEQLGDDIYDSPEYSYTLTPSQLSAIRQFNKDAGSYSNTTMPESYEFGEDNSNNNALNCETITDKNTGLQYSVKCISTFLNNNTNKYFTSQIAREETTKFTLWQESNYCISNGNCVLSRVDGIGPSWK